MNWKTGAFYVGKTVKPLEDRLREHLRQPGNKYLRHDIPHFGRESFGIEALEEMIPASRLDRRETYWIKTLNPPYNLRKNNKKWGTRKFREPLASELSGQ